MLRLAWLMAEVISLLHAPLTTRAPVQQNDTTFLTTMLFPNKCWQTNNLDVANDRCVPMSRNIFLGCPDAQVIHPIESDPDPGLFLPVMFWPDKSVQASAAVESHPRVGCTEHSWKRACRMLK